MSSPSRPRRKSKLTPFTVDELLDNPAMSGFVSFLEVRPEPRGTTSQTIEPPPLSRSLPDSTVHPDSTLQPDSTVHSGGDVPPDSTQLPGSTVPPGSNLLPEINLPPGSTVQSDSTLLPDSIFLTDRRLLPDSTLPSGSSVPSDSNLIIESTLPSDGSLLSGSELRTEKGRTVRIRQARAVQDAHTSAEHTLWQLLWRKGTDETDSTRLIKAGLGEISRWTGAHKTSCRAYLRALIAKLAIEEAETFNASAGKDGARVYRVHSGESILERRRAAGYTHVIRTGAITFVDPKSGSRLLPGGEL